MSKVTVDPRCPSHPAWEVYKRLSELSEKILWVCSVCRRPLGYASLGWESTVPWPRDRSVTPEDRSLAKVEWNWSVPGATKPPCP